MAKLKSKDFMTCKECPVKDRRCVHYGYQKRAVCAFSTEYYLKRSKVLDWRLEENIDIDIIPVLKRLWTAGIYTLHSCAGHESAYHEAYLIFRKHDRFIRYLADNGKRAQKLKDGNYGYFSWEKDNINDPAPTGTAAKTMRDEFIRVLSEYPVE